MNKYLIMMMAGGLIIALGLVLKFAGDDFYKTGKSKIYIPHSEISGQQSDFLKSPNVRWEKIAQHYTPSKGIKDWQNFQPTTHWRKGYSAYEIAHSWENANPDLPEEIKALFGGTTELLAATPEHKTPLPGGSRPSQTDVLAFIRTDGKVCAVAVEGKADEDFGQTVGAWLKNASAGKIERLKYISEKLGLRYPPADNIRYQLLHRTASAVIEAERFNADCAAMVIHSFSREQKSFRDFGTFLSLFGIRSVGNDHLYTSNKPGIPLSFGWVSSKRGVAYTGTAVQKFPINAATIIMFAGGLLVVIGFVVSVKQRNRSTDNEANQSEHIKKQQGNEFEDYVIKKFNMLKNHEKNNPSIDKNKRFVLLRDRSDKNRDGVSAEANKDPDFEIGFWLNDQKKFAVECKWKSKWEGGFIQKRIKIADTYKLKHYKKYQDATGLKTFIVLGIGGLPNAPESVYIIPLDKLENPNKNILTFDKLKPYREVGEQEFFYYYHKEQKLHFF